MLFYHIVVSDRRYARDGRFIERIGFFDLSNDSKGKEELYLDIGRINYWLSVGAQPSNRVTVLIKKYKKLKNHTVYDK